MRDRTPAADLFRLACVPAVWSGHFIACYAAVSLACRFDARSVTAPVLLATLAALALLAWIGAQSSRSRRRLRSGHDGAAATRFLALATVMLCVLSALAVLWVAFPAAVLPPCAA